MNFKQFIIAVSFFLVPASSFADDVPDKVMINTIRCEAGRVGEKMKAAGLSDNQKVIVTWKDSQTNASGGGGSLKFLWFPIGGSADLSKQDIDEANSDGLSFNLNTGNEVVCKTVKNQIIKEGVGVYKCLVETKFDSLQVAIEGGTGSTGCHHQVTLGKKISGNLQLNLWGVASVGPDGSWGDTHVYDIVIAAPPPKKAAGGNRSNGQN